MPYNKYYVLNKQNILRGGRCISPTLDNEKGERSKNVVMENLHGDAGAGLRLEPAQAGYLVTLDRTDQSDFSPHQPIQSNFLYA